MALLWERLRVHLYEHAKVHHSNCLCLLVSTPRSPGVSADWGGCLGSRVFLCFVFFSFLNLPSIALLIPAPDMKETNHTGVSSQTSKVVY